MRLSKLLENDWIEGLKKRHPGNYKEPKKEQKPYIKVSDIGKDKITGLSFISLEFLTPTLSLYRETFWANPDKIDKIEYAFSKRKSFSSRLKLYNKYKQQAADRIIIDFESKRLDN